MALSIAMWVLPFPDVKFTPTSPNRFPNSFCNCSIIFGSCCVSSIVMNFMFSFSCRLSFANAGPMKITFSHSFMLASLKTVCQVPFPSPSDAMRVVI